MNIRNLAAWMFENSSSWRNWRLSVYNKADKFPYFNKKQRLPKNKLQEARKFWRKYQRIDTFFHEFYTQKTGEFHVAYLPDNIYYTVIDRYYNNENLAKWLDDKSLYESLLIDNLGVVKSPEMVCMRSGGYWVTPNFTPLTVEDMRNAVFAAGEVFIKASIDSYGGKGVQYFNAEKKQSSDLDNIIAKMGKNIVIQKKIQQSAILNQLNPSSVNTIRVLSFLQPNGGVKIYSSVLRIGINGAFVDNASSGGITVGIKEDGSLKSVAYTAHGEKFDKVHPNTGVAFDSIVIPDFVAITDAVKRLHYRLPRLRLLSWDFAIDKDNTPVLIEVNMNQGELDFHQLNNGPLFGEDTQLILDEVFGK